MLACSGTRFLPVLPRSLPNTSSHWQGSLVCLCQVKCCEIKNLKKWCSEGLIRCFLLRKLLNGGNSVQHPSGGSPNAKLEFKETGFLSSITQISSSASRWGPLFPKRNIYFWMMLIEFLVISVIQAQPTKNWSANKKCKEKIKMIHNFQILQKFIYVCVLICLKHFLVFLKVLWKYNVNIRIV